MCHFPPYKLAEVTSRHADWRKILPAFVIGGRTWAEGWRSLMVIGDGGDCIYVLVFTDRSSPSVNHLAKLALRHKHRILSSQDPSTTTNACTMVYATVSQLTLVVG
jgi:hypothetical protein